MSTRREFVQSALLGLSMLTLPLPSPAADATPMRVLYPRPESTQDMRQRYPLEVLRLALRRSGGAFRLEPSPFTMQQARALHMLASGDYLDVLWTVPTRERTRKLRMIPFPIDRGLIGWRVLMIHRGEEPRFSGIHSLRQLASLSAGQGHDWPDLDVLRANGLEVTGVATYNGLFQMLARRHIDYLPRSVTEVDDELKRFASLPITLDSHLLLHYASALCLFVNPRNTRLARALLLGLTRSYRDGSLMELFHRTYDGVLQSLDLARRTRLELRNPDFPSSLPARGDALWYRPGDRAWG